MYFIILYLLCAIILITVQVFTNTVENSFDSSGDGFSTTSNGPFLFIPKKCNANAFFVKMNKKEFVHEEPKSFHSSLSLIRYGLESSVKYLPMAYNQTVQKQQQKNKIYKNKSADNKTALKQQNKIANVENKTAQNQIKKILGYSVAKSSVAVIIVYALLQIFVYITFKSVMSLFMAKSRQLFLLIGSFSINSSRIIMRYLMLLQVVTLVNSTCVQPTNTTSTTYSNYCSAFSPTGDECTPICANNFYDVGNLTIVCKSDGSWTLSSGSCQPNPFVEVVKLIGSGYTRPAYQGVGVAISGDGLTAASGGKEDDGNNGAAWFFICNISFIPCVWQQQGPKVFGVGLQTFDTTQFGSSAALSYNGSIAVIGAIWDNGFIGCACVFTRVNGVWNQQGPKLVGSGEIPYSNQGSSVVITPDGNTIAVAGDSDNNYLGAFWVYTFSASSGSYIQSSGKLFGSGPLSYQAYSISISADGNTIIECENNGLNAFWTFTRNGTDGIWSQQIMTTTPSSVSGVALTWDGDIAFVSGASLFIYSRAGSVWNLLSTTVIPYGGSSSVTSSSDGKIVAVGVATNTGILYTFSRDGGANTWSLYGPSFTASDCIGSCLLGFPISISSDASTLIVGGQGDNGNNGAAWVFTHDTGISSMLITSIAPSSVFNNTKTVVTLNGLFNASAVISVALLYNSNSTIALVIPLFSGDILWYAIQFELDTTTAPLSLASIPYHYTVLLICQNQNITFNGIYITTLPELVSINTTFSSTPNLIAGPSTLLLAYFDGGTDDQYFKILLDGVIINGNQMPVTSTVVTGQTLSISVIVVMPSAQTSITLDSPYNLIYVSAPTITSICPSRINSLVNTQIVVQGFGFFFSPSILAYNNVRCVVNGSFFSIPTSISTNSITCNVQWPFNVSSLITVLLTVANDADAFGNSIPLIVAGSCESEKPNSIAGQNGCECPAGFSDTGVICQACVNGFYQNQTNQPSCIPCGDNQDTNNKYGSLSVLDCVCKAGNFPNPTTGLCLHCLPGMYCPGNNVVEIEPGYWRANNRTEKVSACPGGATACIGTTNSSSLCAVGYNGPLCLVCARGYAQLGMTCVQCPKTGLNSFALIVLIFFAVLLSYFLIQSASSFKNDTGSYTTKDENKKKQQRSAEVVVKVALNYTQGLYYIGRLTSNWSVLVHRFFSSVGILSALSSNNYTIHCAANWRFYDSLIAMYVSPIIVVSILTVIYTIRHFLKGIEFKQTKTDYQLALMLLLYQIHPTIMLEVINAFPCQHVPGTHTSYLKADMSVDCNSPQYKAYTAFSAIYMIIYIFGMLVLTLWRLRHNYHAGKLADTSHNAFVKYAFFFVGYKSDTYYWEAVILLRKMGIVAFSVLPSAMLQLVFANVIIMISIVLNIKYVPFASPFINRIESYCLYALYATVVLGFLFISDNNALWISIFVILINTAMASFLFVVFVKKMRDVMTKLMKKVKLPIWLKFCKDNDEFGQVIDTKNPRAAPSSTELASL